VPFGFRKNAHLRFLPLSGEKLWQADKIVGGEHERELCADAFDASQHGLGGWLLLQPKASSILLRMR